MLLRLGRAYKRKHAHACCVCVSALRVACARYAVTGVTFKRRPPQCPMRRNARRIFFPAARSPFSRALTSCASNSFSRFTSVFATARGRVSPFFASGASALRVLLLLLLLTLDVLLLLLDIACACTRVACTSYVVVTHTRIACTCRRALWALACVLGSIALHTARTCERVRMRDVLRVACACADSIVKDRRVTRINARPVPSGCDVRMKRRSNINGAHACYRQRTTRVNTNNAFPFDDDNCTLHVIICTLTHICSQRLYVSHICVDAIIVRVKYLR
jgi:hypothetical protein